MVALTVYGQVAPKGRQRDRSSPPGRTKPRPDVVRLVNQHRELVPRVRRRLRYPPRSQSGPLFLDASIAAALEKANGLPHQRDRTPLVKALRLQGGEGG